MKPRTPDRSKSRLLLVASCLLACGCYDSTSSVDDIVGFVAVATTTMMVAEDTGGPPAPGTPTTFSVPVSISGLPTGYKAIVTLITVDDSATAAEDYVSFNGGITVTQNGAGSVTLTTKADTKFEGDEEFILRITSAKFEPAADFLTIGNTDIRIRIVDNDPDLVAPMVLSTNPVDAAVNVSTGTIVSATFDEPIDLATLTSANFFLDNGAMGALGFDVTTNTATLTPMALMPDTLYTATLTTGIADLSGNNLATNFTWSFRTSMSLDTTPPVTTVMPAGGVFATPVMVTLTCTDNPGGSGCDEILFCIGTGCTPTTVYTGPIAVTSTSDISFFSKDAAGNMELLRTESYTIGTPAVAQTSGIGAAQAMDLLPDGGYVLAGDTGFAGSLAAQLWVMRLGADNSVAWRFTYESSLPPRYRGRRPRDE